MTAAICWNEELTAMPLHEYVCDVCGHRFEIIQKFSDPPIEKCPKCAGSVHKLVSSPAFQFKGSGWYVTDYAKKDQAGGPKTDPKSESAAKEGAEKADKTNEAVKSSATPGESTSANPSTTTKKE